MTHIRYRAKTLDPDLVNDHLWAYLAKHFIENRAT
jgi:hypothetical protein